VLAADDDTSVRAEVAGNPTTPDDVIRALADLPD